MSNKMSKVKIVSSVFLTCLIIVVVYIYASSNSEFGSIESNRFDISTADIRLDCSYINSDKGEIVGKGKCGSINALGKDLVIKNYNRPHCVFGHQFKYKMYKTLKKCPGVVHARAYCDEENNEYAILPRYLNWSDIKSLEYKKILMMLRKLKTETLPCLTKNFIKTDDTPLSKMVISKDLERFVLIDPDSWQFQPYQYENNEEKLTEKNTFDVLYKLGRYFDEENNQILKMNLLGSDEEKKEFKDELFSGIMQHHPKVSKTKKTRNFSKMASTLKTETRRI